MNISGYENYNPKNRKKRMAAIIISAAVAVSAASAAGFCCYKFYNDPYWQMLHSFNKLKNSESFSFEIKTTQTISLDLPVLADQHIENETVYKGDIQFNKDEDEFIMLAESEKNSVLLYNKDGNWKIARKENITDAKWSEEEISPSDIFNDNDAVTAGFYNRNMIAKSSSKGLSFISDAFKGYKFLSEYSDLEISRGKKSEEISGTVYITEILENLNNDDSNKDNPVFSAIMLLLGDEPGTINMSSMKCSDGEICLNNSSNYPDDLTFDCSVTFDAAEFLSEKAKDIPKLQSIIGFLGGFIETDAKCDISADIQFFNYGEAHIDTEVTRDIID
ncbi:MAG: hypothetical protein ACI4JN_10690 [Ruminococcus sp.]